MPPRNAFKTNASFFRMLALGAVGAQTVQQHLNGLGHRIVELERGALSTKIWRDVKRKRVRIPDLCCTACGVRIESRAKTSPDLRMSHSTGDAERAWDYGMLDRFRRHQVIAGHAAPLGLDECRCRQGCNRQRVEEMLRSRERTSRFTGCKLARLAAIEDIADAIRDLAQDTAEDMYVRLEARSYLCEVVNESADRWFRPALLDHPDDQMRLETAVALAETRNPGAFGLLRLVIEDRRQPTFLRSACAWAIGCHGTHEAAECLVGAFADLAPGIREEALAALENLGEYRLDALLTGLASRSSDIAAGSAEAIRRVREVPENQVRRIVELAESSESTWPAWALAHLPQEEVRPYIATLQDRRPDIHYALSVLRTFLESWVAEDWTPRWTA